MAEQHYHKSNAVFDKEHTWRYRVLLASFPADPMGVIVRAVLGRNLATGAAMSLSAKIDIRGQIICRLRQPNGIVQRYFRVGHVNAIRDEFRRLADHCKLDDDEREALFEELKKWAGKDERAMAGLDIPVPARVV